MIDIPLRSEAPLTRDSILSVNQKRVQGPLDSQSVRKLNLRSNAQQGSAPTGMPQLVPSSGAAERRLQRMSIPVLRNPVRKGQKTPLEDSGRLRSIRVCMGWNVQNADCDVDVSAFLLRNGKVPGDDWFVFYGQERSPDGSTVFSTNAAPDRELITIDLTRLDPLIDRIAFILTINEAFERKLNFSMIRDAYVRVIDSATDRELVSFQIEEYYANVISMTIGEVYLHNGTWKFNAVGNGIGKDLAGLCQFYGVRVE